jgi:hypothetical protein
VGTVDRKNLECVPIHIANPARDISRITVPGINNGISIRGEASLAGGKLIETAEGNPRLIAAFSRVGDGREKVADNRNGQNRGDDAVKQDSEFHEKITPAESGRDSHRISSFDFPVVGKGWPGNFVRWEASQAMTSETSCGDIGFPGTLPRQSGAPSSGRPAITIVRSSWSVSSARNGPATIELAFCPPLPPDPWQDEQYVA